MAELRLEGVTKTYPSGLVAVRNVSLTVADGELVVLVGPSGCGKSTILRMISGLETVTEGRMRRCAPSCRNFSGGWPPR